MSIIRRASLEVRSQRSAAKAFVEYCGRIFRAQLRILGPEVGRGRECVVLEYRMVSRETIACLGPFFIFLPSSSIEPNL
jgi:hypothetical protein